MKFPATNIRQLFIPSVLLLTSACQANGQLSNEVSKVNESSSKEVVQTADCPIISSQNWSAKIKQGDDGKSMLLIKGDIELPNPGFSIIFEEGIATRSLPPSQHFTIKAERLEGFYIQAVTPMTLEHSGLAIYNQYRSIVIHCGEQVIATIDNVSDKP